MIEIDEDILSMSAMELGEQIRTTYARLTLQVGRHGMTVVNKEGEVVTVTPGSEWINAARQFAASLDNTASDVDPVAEALRRVKEEEGD